MARIERLARVWLGFLGICGAAVGVLLIANPAPVRAAMDRMRPRFDDGVELLLLRTQTQLAGHMSTQELFALALLAWAVVVIACARRGLRTWPVAAACTAAIAWWCVRLSPLFWEELAVTTASAWVFAVVLPMLLAWALRSRYFGVAR